MPLLFTQERQMLQAAIRKAMFFCCNFVAAALW